MQNSLNGNLFSNSENVIRLFTNSEGSALKNGDVVALDFTNFSSTKTVPCKKTDTDTERQFILGVVQGQDASSFADGGLVPVCREGFCFVNSAAGVTAGNVATSDSGTAYENTAFALSSCFGYYLSSVATAGMMPMWVRTLSK